MTAARGTSSDSLTCAGYIRLGHAFFDGRDARLADAREALAASCADLPTDPYARGADRRRRYGTFVLLPWSGTLEAVPPGRDTASGQPVSPYVQTADFNPEQNGDVRGFAPLTHGQAANPFLRWLITEAFDLIASRFAGRPVWVGCHLIRLVAEPQRPGRSTPDIIHCDGEPYTLAVLVERSGIVGGENVIAKASAAGSHPADVDPADILARFTLETPWEGWMVCDERVAHYVSPIAVADDAVVGSRTVLLVDFTPMQPAPLLQPPRRARESGAPRAGVSAAPTMPGFAGSDRPDQRRSRDRP